MRVSRHSRFPVVDEGPDDIIGVVHAKHLMDLRSGASWRELVVSYFWKFGAFASACGWYYCRDDARSKFAPGFTGKGGVAIRLKGSMFLDLGLQYSLSGRGRFFDRMQWWVEPFIGFIYRGDRDRLGGSRF